MFYPNINPTGSGETNVPPDDTVSALEFCPNKSQAEFIASGTWANTVACYQVKHSPGKYTGEYKASHQHMGPILDISWSDDGTKIFSASTDKTVKLWDLGSNQQMQIAAHDAPIRSVHWVKRPAYTCIMTSSWDKTLKFWDMRTPTPIATHKLPERSYCADVMGMMAVVGTADKAILVYQLDPQPSLYKQLEPPFKQQNRCVAIFCDEKKEPTGYALGNIEGRVAVQYVQPKDSKANFTFKCHRSNGQNCAVQDIYAVNDIAFNPIHNTMATAGSDGKFSFWDKDARTRLKMSDQLESSVTKCCINSNGQLLAYATGYDWSKGHEYNQPTNPKNKISFVYCFEDMRTKKR